MKRIICACTLLFSLIFVALVFPCSVQALGNVKILSESDFYDSLGFLWIAGEVQNSGDTPTRFTKISVTYYDSGNNVVGTSFGYADVDVLLPNTKSPFDVLFTDTKSAAKADHVNLTVTWSDYVTGKPYGLQVLSQNSSFDDMGYMHIKGEVKNVGKQTATNVEVIGTFYDSNGKVVGAETNDTSPTTLAPDQVGSYDIRLIYHQQVTKVASYSIIVQSSEYSSSDTYSPPSPSSQTPVPSVSPTIPEMSLLSSLPFAIFGLLIALIISKKKKDCRLKTWKTKATVERVLNTK